MKQSGRCTPWLSENGCMLSDKADKLPRSFPGAKFQRKCKLNIQGIRVTGAKGFFGLYAKGQVVRLDFIKK